MDSWSESLSDLAIYHQLAKSRIRQLSEMPVSVHVNSVASFYLHQLIRVSFNVSQHFT